MTLSFVARPRASSVLPLAMFFGSFSWSFVALAARARSTWPYGIVRFVQMLFVAPVFPIGVAGVPLVVGRLTEAVR